MPKIFSKDCKIKVIEYGSTSKSTMSWDDLKKQVQSLIPSFKSDKKRAS